MNDSRDNWQVEIEGVHVDDSADRVRRILDLILRAAGIPERYDLALMSTKGMSVVAARQLVERLSTEGVRIFVAHDFDKAGLSILHTLRNDTARFQFQTEPNVIELGLRLADVEAMHLESEPVIYAGTKDPREGLRLCGATEEECDYLVEGQKYIGGKYVWVGKRVELNSMLGGARAFVDWIEAQLKKHGVKKLVPSEDVLTDAYRRAWKTARLQDIIDKAAKQLDEAEIEIPRRLKTTITKAIDGKAVSWDAKVCRLARAAARDEDRRAKREGR